MLLFMLIWSKKVKNWYINWYCNSYIKWLIKITTLTSAVNLKTLIFSPRNVFINNCHICCLMLCKQLLRLSNHKLERNYLTGKYGKKQERGREIRVKSSDLYVQWTIFILSKWLRPFIIWSQSLWSNPGLTAFLRGTVVVQNLMNLPLCGLNLLP